MTKVFVLFGFVLICFAFTKAVHYFIKEEPVYIPASPQRSGDAKKVIIISQPAII